MNVEAVESVHSNVSIGVREKLGLVELGWNGSGGRTELALSPADAVAVRNCLMGDTEEADVPVQGTDERLTVEYVEDASCRWKMFYKDSVVLLTPAEAMAMAWGIEAEVADALKRGAREPSVPKAEKPVKHVWCLFGVSVPKCDVGLCEVMMNQRVYASQDAARNALREFMRPLVNSCRNEAEWHQVEREGLDVDGTLDHIMAGDDESTYEWWYSGSTRVMRVRCAEVEVGGEA